MINSIKVSSDGFPSFLILRAINDSLFFSDRKKILNIRQRKVIHIINTIFVLNMNEKPLLECINKFFQGFLPENLIQALNFFRIEDEQIDPILDHGRSTLRVTAKRAPCSRLILFANRIRSFTIFDGVSKSILKSMKKRKYNISNFNFISANISFKLDSVSILFGF